MTLDEAFNSKLTENGDIAFTTTGNNLLDILFLSEYYTNHLDKVHIGTSETEKLFSMMIRDPRHGLGRRDLGRVLMRMSGCSIDEVVAAGRVDDLFILNSKTGEYELSSDVLNYLYNQCFFNNELVKKWMPRYSSKNVMIARAIAKHWGMNKQQYGKFIKCNTVENKLSRKNTDDIIFEHVPSLAMIKYYKRFENGSDTSERFAQYLADVKAGKKEIKVSTTTVYDIYRNRFNIDADLFFDKIENLYFLRYTNNNQNMIYWDRCFTNGSEDYSWYPTQVLYENEYTYATPTHITPEIGKYFGLSYIKKDNVTYSVTKIASSAFMGSSIKSVTLPNTIVEIEDMAFNSCMSLTTITLSESLTTIGVGAFEYCTAFTSQLIIPDCVTTIGERAFTACSMTSLVIGSGIQSIGDYAFGGCSNLTSITIKATTPPTLERGLSGETFYQTNNCPIYVPAGSVNDYKNATTKGWSQYASRIQAIPA